MQPQPIKKVMATDLVCQRIQSSIKEGVWSVGERLPAESVLASMFAVNRLTVRLALQKLNTLGIVETRTGSGTYVVPFDFSDYIKEASDFYMEPGLLDSVCEFRTALELECARLACQRHTPEELEELQGLLEHFNQSMERYHQTPTTEAWKRCAKADLAFHKKIVLMAHNKLFEYAFTVAQQSIYQYILFLNQKRKMPEDASGGRVTSYDTLHQQIFDSLRNGDCQSCQKAYHIMINHEMES